MGWEVSVTPRPHSTTGKDPVPIVQEAVWAPRPVWTGAENLAPTGIRSPDHPSLASRYTDWATWSTNDICTPFKFYTPLCTESTTVNLKADFQGGRAHPSRNFDPYSYKKQLITLLLLLLFCNCWFYLYIDVNKGTNFTYGLPCILNYISIISYISIMNQHDALFVFTLLAYHVSTCFGPIFNPSSGGSKCICGKWCLFFFEAVCRQAWIVLVYYTNRVTISKLELLLQIFVLCVLSRSAPKVFDFLIPLNYYSHSFFGYFLFQCKSFGKRNGKVFILLDR
jgi:hypothetical protein